MKILIRALILSLSLLCSAFLDNARAEIVDLRPLQTPAKEQKNRDTCAYFAVSGLIESAFKKLSGKEYDISEEFEIFRHKIINSWRPEVEFGDTYTLLQNLTNSYFVAPENMLPYQTQSLNFQAPLTSEQTAMYDLRNRKGLIQFRSLKFRMLTQMWSRKSWSELAMNEIKQERPVVVTVKVAIPYVDDAKGIVTYNATIDQECSGSKIICGGHAVLLVGYDSDKKVFLFKNSWGPQWGSQGFGVLSFEHVDNYSDQLLTAYFDKLTSPSVRQD